MVTTSQSQIHLVRHAESEHNVTKNFSLRDPSLTPLGVSQAISLGQKFPQAYKHRSNASVRLVITSPLRRAIQTALYAFTDVLDKQYYVGFEGAEEEAAGSEVPQGRGIENGATLVVDANLQERSALPCDTGSETDVLRALFPGIDFSALPGDWLEKKGAFSEEDEAVERRARAVREGLTDRLSEAEGDVVVVTHGVFMKFLAVDQGIDLPKAGWKTFVVQTHEGDGGATLLAV